MRQGCKAKKMWPVNMHSLIIDLHVLLKSHAAIIIFMFCAVVKWRHQLQQSRFYEHIDAECRSWHEKLQQQKDNSCNLQKVHFNNKRCLRRLIATCWWTSVIDIVKCRNTLIVAKTTAPFACWSLSSRKFIMSKISLLSPGIYLDTTSSTRHCAHSLKSLILQVHKIRLLHSHSSTEEKIYGATHFLAKIGRNNNTEGFSTRPAVGRLWQAKQNLIYIPFTCIRLQDVKAVKIICN